MAGNVVEREGGMGGCCSPVFMARDEPCRLTPLESGSALPKPREGWDGGMGLVLLQPKGRCLMTEGEIRPSPFGESDSDGLCVFFHWKCAVLGAPRIPMGCLGLWV